MNLTTLQTRVRERVGNPSSTDVPDATFTLRINEAYRDICDRYRFHGIQTSPTFTTVAGTVTYAYPANMRIVRQIDLIDVSNVVSNLIKRDIRWWAAHVTTIQNRPSDYMIDGASIYLNSPPDLSTYTIKVWGISDLTDLAAGGDSPNMPIIWHDGLVQLARYKYWETIGDVSRAQAAFASWSSWVQTKTDEVDEEMKTDFDGQAVIPTLQQPTSRFDFDHSP